MNHSNEKTSFTNSYKSLIWVIVILVFIVGVQMYFNLQLKKKIRKQVVLITKLQSVKPNNAKIDSLKTQIKDLEEWIADEDERCTIRMDQFQTQLIQLEYDKNNSK